MLSVPDALRQTPPIIIGATGGSGSRVLAEMRLGKSRQQAWQDMAKRVDLDELRMLVAALRQAEQLGVSIAKTLRTQADSLRTQRSLRVRQIAASLAIKMLFPLIFFILPALFITVLGPGLISIMSGFKNAGPLLKKSFCRSMIASMTRIMVVRR